MNNFSETPARSSKRHHSPAIVLTALAIVGQCYVATSHAAQVTFRAEGTTIWTENGDGLIAGALGWVPPNGTPISYTFTFETMTADQAAGNPLVGLYPALQAVTMQVGSTVVPLGVPIKMIDIRDNLNLGSVLRDWYMLVAGWSTFNGYAVIPDLQMLQDGTAAAPPTAVVNDSLPLTPPDPALFQNKIIKLQVNQSLTSNVTDFVLGIMTSLTIVPSDDDGDGVNNDTDNCSTVANPDQTDTDLDGQGDACDLDNDNDGIADISDNCKFSPNVDQADMDVDGLGNVCDSDPDGDSVVGAADNCPLVPNTDQTDTDGDGVGDDCDTDDDNDSVCDIDSNASGCTAGPDNCPTIHNTDQQDVEGDGIGDACDADLDNDGIGNATDNCPVDGNVDQNDVDGDSQGDVCDGDIDNDTVANAGDNCPNLANTAQDDQDQDGAGDACDADVDGDGVASVSDNCQTVANSDQLNFDGDGSGDACDTDVDGDSVANGTDQCGLTPLGTTVDPQNGCALVQLCPCSGPAGTTVPWKNHGKYVSCVAHVAGDFAASGLITQAQKDALVSAAGQSTCGH